jgi:hypothetical protein
MPTQNLGVQRAVNKVFDTSIIPNGGYSYDTGGWQAGYGLRNEVGLVFDADNNLWGVENSADNLSRVANGQTIVSTSEVLFFISGAICCGIVLCERV